MNTNISLWVCSGEEERADYFDELRQIDSGSLDIFTYIWRVTMDILNKGDIRYVY